MSSLNFRRIAALLVLIFSFSVLSPTVYAAKSGAGLDKKYWPLQTAYNKALKDNDTNAIINNGVKICQLLAGNTDPEKKAAQFEKNGDTMEISILPSVIKNVALAYETKKEYDKAAEYYKKFLPFGKAYQKTLKGAQNQDYNFALTSAEHKAIAFSANIDLYTEIPGAAPGYRGAKYEPKNGVYFGEAFGESPAGVPKNKWIVDRSKKNSAQLIYVLFKDESVRSYDWAFQRAKQRSDIIEVAWNLKGEGAQLKSVLSERKLVEDTADYLNSLNIPILLRFGAEMNIWEIPANPKEFIDAYKFVAEIMRSRAPNVALLWSPNAGSAAGLNYSMFYPGDQYVDWVGISCYTSKYFLGNKKQTDSTQAIYLTGDYANPIEQIRPIVQEYGSKKPIMLSECGVENYSKTNKEDLTGWADLQMRRMYAYAPMVFPEIKAMLYFDFDFENVATGNRYALYPNEKASGLYLELTNRDIFLPQGKKDAGFAYRKIDNTSLSAEHVPVNCYAVYPKNMVFEVTYKIDGKAAAKSGKIPYRAELSFSGLKDGKHTLTVELSSGGKLLKSKTYSAEKQGEKILIK